MEVKIKDNDILKDADWTIEDGVMVVSPKGKIYEFKDGDVLASDKSKVIYIFKENVSEDANIGYIGIDNNQDLNLTESQWGNLIFRPATEEEKQKLFDELAKEGLAWDADKKEIVKLKWKPKVGDKFYYPNYKNRMFIPIWYMHSDKHSLDNDSDIQQWYVFKTDKECQEFCDKLNQAINQVKP